MHAWKRTKMRKSIRQSELLYRFNGVKIQSETENNNNNGNYLHIVVRLHALYKYCYQMW